jgi:hypothetical protein
VFLLLKSSGPGDSLVIAKSLGLNTSSQINPVLYDLLKRGYLKQEVVRGFSKPIWEIVDIHSTPTPIPGRRVSQQGHGYELLES